MARFRVATTEPVQVLVGGWGRSADRPHQPWRSAWVSAGKHGTVASVKVQIDLDETTVTVTVVDKRLGVIHFPTETVRHDIPAKDLFATAEQILLDAACEQLRLAAVQTVKEVRDAD
jgi:hypothetical protein